MFKQSILLLALWSSCGVSALAGELPPPYEAVYEQTITGQKSPMTSKISSDGKGKIKTVSDSPGGKVETLVDYPGKVSTTVMHGQHMWMKHALKEPYKDESVMKKEAKSLGTATFNGHPCHGYESKTGTAVTQTWMGDDIHAMVHFETNTGAAKSVSDLKSYSAKPGDVSLDIPADCKEFKMPGS
jgi:hypothetical protein